ncbi:YitT family protein [Epibacterium ulvae]|uniref:YitT family protein n=1 Tax=Epibacterium ulvae TaxID=1156985 RepID=UPI001BFC94AC|nr:YitT family protein [Epibacterium ulvae]MBT8155944.1 YitT family protein [Epibacterium ulvae]
MTAQRGIFDVQGLTIGIILCSLGIIFLTSAGLVTGQAAGLALLLSYVLPWDFGVTFFAVSAPFLVLAWRRRGRVFTFRTLIVVIGISLAVEALGRVVMIADHGRPLAALLGGILIGIGVLSVFRHNASAGGLSILSLVIEEKTGIKAGWVQLGVDALIFLAACFVLAPGQVFYSFVAAGLMNLIIIWNFDIRQARSGGPLVEDNAGS